MNRIKHDKIQIAITGANGFVGKNVRSVLHKKNIKLVSIARRNFSTYKSEKKIISANLNKNLSLKLKNCVALVHLIGTGHQNISSDFENVNVQITKNTVSLCKKSGIKKIIYLSGLGVSKNSTSGYFISKYKAEQEIINSGLDYTIFRASYILGKNDPLTKCLNNQIKNGCIIIPGSGNYHLQPIFVNDVAKIIFLSINSKQFSNKIFDLVGPEVISFHDYVTSFIGMKNIKIKNIELEEAYHSALHNPRYAYSIDDLNIMVGDFLGNHKKIKKTSKLKFKKFREIL